MAGFHIENFGCRAARADGEAIAARLREQGLAHGSVAESSVVVVNACSVTAEAERQARAFLRKTRRLNPGAKLVVTGCYAQRAPAEVAALDGVSAVVGNSHKGLAPEIVNGLLHPAARGVSDSPIPPATLFAGLSSVPVWADDGFAHSQIESAQVVAGSGLGFQTRPNLKIQEGCGNRCTFCVIPTTRGASRSLAAGKVLAQVRGFVASGGRELVLSGINLGRWGRDLGEVGGFAGLVREILEQTGLARLRLSSVEPMDWTPELIGLMRVHGGKRLARHAHLPLQSGSDGVLRRMHRRYRPWHYEQKAAALLDAAGESLALGADVMAGFPGETEAEFRETLLLIERLPFAYLHLFPFSPRPGTAGWELDRQSPVPAKTVAGRMKELEALAAEKSREFRARFVGRALPGITLQTPAALKDQGRTAALTDNFLPVELMRILPANRLVEMRVTERNAAGVLLGEISSTDGNMAVAR